MIKIPKSNRKKALFIIDVQSAFLNPSTKNAVENIQKLIARIHYDLYVDAVFHAEKVSLWDKQQGWTCPQTDAMRTIPPIESLLINKPRIAAVKTTKSIFKGNLDILKLLRERNIQEVHIVGFQTNDCILASAYESFDYGFFTYVIEECCGTESKDIHEESVKLLQLQNMTNNSCVEKLSYEEIT